MIPVLLLSLTGCGDSFLDLRNPNEATDETYWTKEENAYKALGSLYTPLARKMYGYFGAHTGFQLMNTRTDDTFTIPAEEAQIWMICNFTNISSNLFVSDVYEPLYAGINRTNKFLAKIGETPMDDDTKQIWIGEAKFIRAIHYHLIAVNFGYAPLRLIPVSDDENEINKEGATEEQLWAQVESDLKDAIASLPVTHSGNESGRATKGAAIAYLGKSYIYQGKYKEAEEQLSIIMKAPYTYELVDNPDDNFSQYTEFNKESIFEINYDSSFGGTGSWGHEEDSESLGCVYPNFFGPEGTGGWFKYLPSAALVEAFVAEERPANSDTKFDKRMYTSLYFKHSDYNDVKEDETWYGGMSFDDIWKGCYEMKIIREDPGYPDVEGKPGRFLLKKFTNFFLDRADANSMYTTGNGDNNLRIMRFAEVLLLHAEACIKLNKLDEAAADLHRIRDRAGLARKTWANADELWKEMEHQKFLEMFFEGQRFLDLRRWYTTDEMKAILKKNGHRGADNYQEKYGYYPIPESEIFTNTKLEQNPLWR